MLGGQEGSGKNDNKNATVLSVVVVSFSAVNEFRRNKVR